MAEPVALTSPALNARRRELAHAGGATPGALSATLQRLTKGTGADPDIEAAHQLAIRAEQLANVVLSAVCGDLADLDECEPLLHGPEVRRMKGGHHE